MSSIFPPPTITPQQLKAIRANLLTEHFGWAPESFVKSAMDLANVCMYAATEAAEKNLLQIQGIDEEEVQKGIYQLETLLESAIDKHFDLYEIFVLRNTFSIPTELIPWIVLKHQESLVPSLSGSETLDEKAAFNEYAEELKFYEAELEKERQLACAKEWVRRKVEKCAEQAEEVGAMSGPEPLSTQISLLQSQLTPLIKSLKTLLTSTPLSNPSHLLPDPTDPFNGSRAEYINTTSEAKIERGGNSGRRGTGTGGSLELVQKEIGGTGEGGDALALLAQITDAAKRGAA